MNLLRNLPKVDKFITHPLLAGLNKHLLVKLSKEAIEELRQEILANTSHTIDEDALARNVKRRYEALFEPSLKPLINATGLSCIPTWAEVSLPNPFRAC